MKITCRFELIELRLGPTAGQVALQSCPVQPEPPEVKGVLGILDLVDGQV